MAPKRRRAPTASATPNPEPTDEGFQAHEFEIKINRQHKAHPKPGRKRKHGQMSSSPEPKFELDLIKQLNIQPQALWNSLPSYNNFVVEPVIFKRARVLEIRASDPSHVYLRVAWFYWPDELPMGRKEYHGLDEIIESNHPDIIDAMSVEGLADVMEWDEKDEDAELSGNYYRQQLDYMTNQLSTPKPICICSRPHNPDGIILECSSCKTWLHDECITTDAVKRHNKRGFAKTEKSKSNPNIMSPKPLRKGPKKEPSIEPNIESSVAAVVFDGRLRIKEEPKGNDRDSDSGLDTNTIIDEEIRCLNCGEFIS
ncbi:hypothetical protein H072_7852 [Dactylellina haptotyla CBS 200.50]|uniref:BAH domain-containing protein n=1 Tax=Dactylellina haptotyla (strain CBS 200.50) TaxID=1284197 RepID=S8BT77_DACHA|nr:hypothetical protein H072_7852 [Dactylellina haptotyla CBS 200.50]